jgi:hypothetical protein
VARIMGFITGAPGHRVGRHFLSRPSPLELEESTMFRSLIRKSLLVSTLAAVFAAGHGSAEARPGPDDDPNYNHPMWIFANPAEVYRTVAGDPQPDPWVVSTFDAGQHPAVTP